MDVQANLDLLPAMPIPLYATTRIGTVTSDNGDTFALVVGLDENIVHQLKERSLADDPELIQNTSDRKRYGEGSYEMWYAKGRIPFALIHGGDGALAALVTYGPKPLGRKSLKHLSAKELESENVVAQGEWHTIAFRSYPPYRGIGIMKGFTKATMDMYVRYFPAAKLWLGIERKNIASVGLATKLGFTINESISDPAWVTMVKAGG